MAIDPPPPKRTRQIRVHLDRDVDAYLQSLTGEYTHTGDKPMSLAQIVSHIVNQVVRGWIAARKPPML